ncbi:MAG: rod shape-determining protein RodA, partial [Proteobacteria bacterium]|nr:rod shape-determining protein RodA [Pseudomonadota bacterium]
MKKIKERIIQDNIYHNRILDALFIFIIILAFGILSIAGLYSAEGGFKPIVIKQLIIFIMCAPLMFFVHHGIIETLHKYAYHIYALLVAILVLSYFIGHRSMGAQRWIQIFGIILQPSEFMKLGLIFAFARCFDMVNFRSNQFHEIFFLLLLLLAPFILVLKQPNLGTALILCIIAFAILFVMQMPNYVFITPAVIIIFAAPFLWGMLHDYQKNRILTFLNPEKDLLGTGYNIAQSKIAIGAGGALGKNFMMGSQAQLSFLPEKHTDFIMTLIAEEFGFVGTCFIILLYVALISFCYFAALNSNDIFCRIASIGIGTMIFAHAFINMGMISGLLPVVGTPLPMLSYGRSNLISTILGIWIVRNIQFLNCSFYNLKRKKYNIKSIR